MKAQIEYSSVEEIRSFQDRALVELLARVNENSVYYRNLFLENGININEIRGVGDLDKLPFTTKEDLAAHNEDFLCVKKTEIADFVTTSGSLGDPVAFYLTKKDIERLAYNEAISFACAGGSGNDIFQLMTTMDKQFMAGLAYYQGALRLGAGIIRVGPGAPYLQWESIRRFKPTILIAIPSFIPKLVDHARQNGIDYLNSGVRSVICIGEPIRNDDFSLNELGRKIKELWDIELYSTYASTEMGVAFTECEHGVGGHHHPELVILEVIGEDDRQVGDCETGEVVITTLGVEGMPVIRYRTGDLCTVHYSPCGCGRRTARLGPVIGRKQQMIKFKGTTIFPPAIFNVLEMVPEIRLFQVEVSKDEFGNDLIAVILSEEIKTGTLEKELISLFKSRLRVSPEVKFIDEKELNGRIFIDIKRKPQKLIYR